MLSVVFSMLLASPFAPMQEMTEQEAIDLAVKTLTEELKIEDGDAEVVSTLPVRWPDSSLGCPQKGYSYLQVVVPGYRVVFRHDKQTHRVHVGDGRAVYCKGSIKEPQVLGRKEGIVASIRISRMAQEDLASRLGIDADEITVNFIKSTTWPDASLGCPEEGKTYDKVATEGFLIELAYQDKTFEYHADRRKPLLCEP